MKNYIQLEGDVQSSYPKDIVEVFKEQLKRRTSLIIFNSL